MKEIILNTETMTSLQIAEVTGKPHNDVLKAIRSMEPAWAKVNGGNFSLVGYKDAKGEMRPMYQLNKTECLYVATKFNDEARAKLVIRWEELEREKQRKPMTAAEILLQNAQALVEQERKMNQLEAKVEEIDTRTRTRPDYFTVVGYATLNGISVNLSTASRYGAKAARKCKDLGVPTDTIPDPRFGQVKMYPRRVLDEIFNELI